MTNSTKPSSPATQARRLIAAIAIQPDDTRPPNNRQTPTHSGMVPADSDRRRVSSGWNITTA